MKIKVPFLENGEVKYKKREVGTSLIPILKEVGIDIGKKDKEMFLSWKCGYVMIDDNLEYEEGLKQENVLRKYNLL